MATVTDEGITTTVPEGVARLLVSDLRLTMEGKLTNLDIELVFNWVETLQQDLARVIANFTGPDDELSERVGIFDDVLNLRKLPFVDPDGQVKFMTLQEYEFSTGQCKECSATRCPYYIRAHVNLN